MDTPSTITSRVADALRRLAERRWSLLLFILALNAVARPYGGLIHDARLYALQVQNRVTDGAYDADLFFRYGSQDSYSLFSMVVAPMVRLLGLLPTFFLLYLLFNALFFLALIRLVEALIDDRAVSTLGLLFLACASTHFGGFEVFQVKESFLTPRLLANAVVLFALERALRQKWIVSVLLALAATLIHPLMGIGGLLLVVAYLAVERVDLRLLTTLLCLAAVAGLVVLFYRPLGLRVFGEMDPQWRDWNLWTSIYNFPTEWDFLSWLNVAVAVAVLATSIYLLRDEKPQVGRFLGVAGFVGLVGLTASLASCFLPYALLLQAQPYRMLWILEILQVPLAIFVSVRLWKTGQLGSILGIVLLVYLASSDPLLLQYVVPLFLLPLTIIACRGLSKEPIRPDWMQCSLALSLLIGLTIWSAYKVYLFVANGSTLLSDMDPLRYSRLISSVIGATCWVLIALVLLVRLRRTQFGPAFALTTLGTFLVIESLYFALPKTPAYVRRYMPEAENVRFVADYVKERASDPQMTVYCPFASVDQLWFDVEANIFFDSLQMVGTLFSRDTAVEAFRRAATVRAFEIERIQEQKLPPPDFVRVRFRHAYNTDLETPVIPERQDLLRLCQESDLDCVALKRRFDGLYAATNGEIYIYDCRCIRQQQATTAKISRDD